MHVADELDAEHAAAYRIADNKTGELAEWKLSELAVELEALRAGPVDITAMGWSASEIDRLIAAAPTVGLCDPDAMPDEVPRRVRRGEVWQLGRHRLFCGDPASSELPDAFLGSG